MNKTIESILNDLENAGYEAYIVGGFVRDYLLGITSYDIDICTSATPVDIQNIIQNGNTNNYGGINYKINKLNIDITTFRKEIKYFNRRPEVIYINDLKEDILRRDFTINAICMDKNGKIIDYVNGVNDINAKKIRMIDNNIKERLMEDPLRILRAIRFSCVLDFEINDDLYKEIMHNHSLVKTLSQERIKEELDKILINENFMKGINYLKDFHILEDLEIDYQNIVYVKDICGMYAQLNIKNKYPFTKQENTNIINISRIINEGIINNHTLYNYGLYICLVCAEILGLDKEEITNMYNELPIKDDNDLDITNEEIINILGTKIINDKKREIIDKVLNNEIKNKKEEISKYLKES